MKSMRTRVRVAIGVWVCALCASISIGSAQLVTKPGDPLPGITPMDFTLFRLVS
jgi:hypothetical protein